MKLFNDLRPVAPPPSIDLRCCSVEELIAWCKENNVKAKLLSADPPWHYGNEAGNAAPGKIYSLLTMAQIADHLDSMHDIAEKNARFALWNTWPQLGEWAEMTALRGKKWRWGRFVSGGSWHKHGRTGGVGYHWLGDTEPVLLYTKGSPPCTTWDNLSNGHDSDREAHSEKPTEWERAWLRRWTDPGDLVIDFYAGRAPLARACAAENRRYLGAEIDPDRHAQALTALARYLEAM